MRVILVRRRAACDRRHSVLSEKPPSVTLVLCHICVLSIIVTEASVSQRQGLNLDISGPTSLIGAHMQITPLFIHIDEYIRKQPGVK